MAHAPNQVGTYHQLAGASDVYSTSATAYIKIKDVFAGETWRLPIQSVRVTYTMNAIPRMVATMPLGQRVAQRDPWDYGFYDWYFNNNSPPANDKFYEVKVMADLNGSVTFPAQPPTCLFRGTVESANMVDAQQVASGRRMVKLVGAGTAGLLRNMPMGARVANDVGGNLFPSLGDNMWGQNQTGELDASIAHAIGSGSVSIPDMLRDAITSICDRYIANGPAGSDSPATTAKWVIQNMLMAHDQYDWYIDVAGGERGQTQMGMMVMQMLLSQNDSVWSLLSGLAQQFNLGIISGVNKLIVAPMVRPRSELNMTLSGTDITHASSSGEGHGVRGARIEQTRHVVSDGVHGQSVEEEVRTLTEQFWEAAHGRVQTFDASRWPWLRFVRDPSSVARSLARQYVVDSLFGSTNLSVQVPYVHEAFPGTVMRVKDLHGFDYDVGEGVIGTQYDKEDANGVVHSVEVSIQGGSPSGQVGGISTSITLSHVAEDDVYESIVMDGSDHVISDSAYHNFVADYNTWSDRDFDPSGSEIDYPSGMD